MNEKKKVRKYMSLYMSLGMCFGVSAGLIYGNVFSPGNLSLGMSLGIPIGMCIGMLTGAAKDKKLSENMMKVSKIEVVPDSSNVLIYVIDKNGEEKEYKVCERKMKEEKFAVGNRVAEEADGSLVSLESD